MRVCARGTGRLRRQGRQDHRAWHYAALGGALRLVPICGAPSGVGSRPTDDRNRLRLWREAWVDAVAKARAKGNGPAIDAQGPLFDPDQALPKSRPPAGRYHCRVFKLGAKGPATRDFTAYPVADCRIENEGDVSSLYRVSGAQRPIGLLFDDGTDRTVFLGTMALGDETKPLDYGVDTSRDMAGFVQRIGDRRWRLVLPYPHFESMLDVVELTPADESVQTGDVAESPRRPARIRRRSSYSSPADSPPRSRAYRATGRPCRTAWRCPSCRKTRSHSCTCQESGRIFRVLHRLLVEADDHRVLITVRQLQQMIAVKQFVEQHRIVGGHRLAAEDDPARAGARGAVALEIDLDRLRREKGRDLGLDAERLDQRDLRVERGQGCSGVSAPALPVDREGAHRRREHRRLLGERQSRSRRHRSWAIGAACANTGADQMKVAPKAPARKSRREMLSCADARSKLAPRHQQSRSSPAWPHPRAFRGGYRSTTASGSIASDRSRSLRSASPASPIVRSSRKSALIATNTLSGAVWMVRT